jgi:hypothetical protein
MINTNPTGSSACQGAKILTPGRAKSHSAQWAYLLTGMAPSTTTFFGHWRIPSGGTGAGGSADAWALTRQTTMGLGKLTETHRPRSVGLEAANVSGRGTSSRIFTRQQPSRRGSDQQVLSGGCRLWAQGLFMSRSAWRSLARREPRSALSANGRQADTGEYRLARQAKDQLGLRLGLARPTPAQVADVSEFRLRMLMQRSASPFAINSAVRDRWLRALISPLGGPCRLFTSSGARSAVLALYADLPFMYLIELVADGLCGRSPIQRRRRRRRAFAWWAPPGWPGLAPRAAGATGFVAKR